MSRKPSRARARRTMNFVNFRGELTSPAQCLSVTERLFRGRQGPMKTKSVACVLAMALTVQGCSSRPREFTPMLTAPPASTAEFDAAAADCTQLLVAGKLDRNGRLSSAAGGAATGAGVAVAGSAAAAATAGYAGMAVAAATIVLLPFALVG